MPDLTTHRYFKGKACLTKELAQRTPPTFLNRNLSVVLDAHDLLLGKRPCASAGRDMADGTTLTTLQWPCVDEEAPRAARLQASAQAEELLEAGIPVLNLDALQIRLLDAQDGGFWREDEHVRDGSDAVEDGNDDMDWISQAKAPNSLSCNVMINVVHPETHDPEASFTQSAKIRRYDGQSTTTQARSAYFHVQLDKPFHLKLGSNIPNACAEHELEIHIWCEDRRDSATLLGYLETCDPAYHSGTPLMEMRLKARWHAVSQSPPDSELLQLERRRGSKALLLPYGIALSMGWSRNDTPLATLNKLRAKAITQLPTPDGSDRNDEPKTLGVRYSFQTGIQERVFNARNLRCMFCVRRTPYPSLERLMFHYLTFHEHFRFELQDTDPACVAISLEVNDRYVALGPDFDVDQESTWIAPNTPFDLTAHLNGDDTWANAGASAGKSTGKPTKSVLKRGRPPKVGRVERSEIRASLTSQNPEDLDAIEDLPPRERSKYVVPTVPGGKFYHSTSKQPVHPQEAMSETDDVREDSWVLPRERREELQMTEVAAAFHEAFNRHIGIEAPACKAHVRAAVVRFARKHRQDLPAWREDFAKKLDILRRNGIIQEDVIDYCLEWIRVSSGERKTEGCPNVDEMELDQPKIPSAISGATEELVEEVGLNTAPDVPLSDMSLRSQTKARRASPSVAPIISAKPSRSQSGTKTGRKSIHGQAASIQPSDNREDGAKVRPLARRHIHYTSWHNGISSSGKVMCKELVKDSVLELEDVDKITVKDLDWEKFTKDLMLNFDLAPARSKIIWRAPRKGHGEGEPVKIQDARTWLKVLSVWQAGEELVFEITR